MITTGFFCGDYDVGLVSCSIDSHTRQCCCALPCPCIRNSKSSLVRAHNKIQEVLQLCTLYMSCHKHTWVLPVVRYNNIMKCWLDGTSHLRRKFQELTGVDYAPCLLEVFSIMQTL